MKKEGEFEGPPLGNPGRFLVVMGLLLAALVLVLVLNVCIGSVSIPISRVAALLFGGEGAEITTEGQILFRIRLPRMLLAPSQRTVSMKASGRKPNRRPRPRTVSSSPSARKARARVFKPRCRCPSSMPKARGRAKA